MVLTNGHRPAAPPGRRFYLGLDGGGTSTRALLADETGTAWGAGRAGSANPNHYPPQDVQDSLRGAVRAALGGLPEAGAVVSAFLGSSGVSTDSDRADMRATLSSALEGLPRIGRGARVEVDSDTRVGLAGGLAGRPGLVLVAGTGSACYGVNAQGGSFLCGGWGAVADDVGSAPWVGVRAIQAAVRAEDGRGPATRLREAVFGHLGLDDPRQLIHRLHNQGLARADIGRLAPLVLSAYDAGDGAAAGIVREAVAGLALLVRAAHERLFGGGECEMILVGGLALSGPPFQTLLLEQIRAAAPGVVVREPELSPVQGAVLEAMRADGLAWDARTVAALGAGVSRKTHV